jgi:hypothetical protein
MIQSKQPPEGPWIDHCSEPLETTEIVINVELVSPESKHPEFPPFGFTLGFETLPEVKSMIFVLGLLG